MEPQQIEKDLLNMENLYARLYFHLAAEYCRTFGEEGESALRKAVRAYGADRGRTNRKDHESRGYSIDLQTLFSAGSFPGKAGFRRNPIDLGPDRRISETLQCPLHDCWKELGGLREGVIHCEEIHAAMWSAYHHEIETRQPKILTRGEELCRFEVFLPSAQGHAGTEQFDAVEPAEYLRRMTDLTAKMYYYLARGLGEAFGLEGDAALRRGIRRFGRERGLRLRRQHLEQGLEINMSNLFTHYDLPSDDRFRRNKIELSDQTRLSETLVCPFHDVWQGYPDGNRIGRIYCEEVHHAIFGGYDPAVQTNLSTTLTQGDDRCRFAVYFRPSNQLATPQWAQDYEQKLT
ncbi:MAG: L-2-amino-thiazoline-4-carboxylic acid hydrolase [Desulfobacterales bacterium]|nr:MAG: L-2-amino-thiazoline-4-carboxylic acid hydrolase [Desulfobacterales bacterium]